MAKRKTYTQISFLKTRQFQSLAKDAFIANPNVTFTYILPLLGKEYNSSEFRSLIEILDQEEKDWVESDGKSVGIRINNEVFELEEVLAMILRDAKMLAEKTAEDNVTSCVLTVAPSFDQSQRIALKNSLILAGMKPLAFINENMAAGLKYTLDSLSKRPSIVVYINMGATEFKVSVIKHSQAISKETNKIVDKIELIGEAWDEMLGGRLFNYEMAEILIEKFNQMPNKKTEITKGSKAFRKVLATAEDVKEKLSAAKFIDVHIDNLVDYVDLKERVTRNKFEERLEKYVPRINTVIYSALKDANVSLGEIDDIELLGGGVRIPFIRDVIQKAFNDSTLNQKLNQDEAMSFGAGFIAASLSNTFKVKSTIIEHSSNYEFSMEVFCLTTNTLLYPKTTLFPKKTPYNIMKAVTFYYDKDIIIALHEHKAKDEKKLITFEVKGIEEFTSIANEVPKISLLFAIDEFGIIDLKEMNATSNNNQSRLEIIREYSYPIPMNEDKIEKAKVRIIEIETHERSLLNLAEVRNNYESLIYDTKNWLNDNYNEQFIVKEDKEALLQSLEKEETWLYKSEESLREDELVTKTEALKGKVASMKVRKEEFEKFPEYIENLHGLVEHARMRLEKINETRTWISKDDFEEVNNIINNLNTWIEGKIIERKEKAATCDPILTEDLIIEQYLKINKTLNALMNIPKPIKNIINETTIN